jgi:Leucine-rich repeat (LRR) protein
MGQKNSSPAGKRRDSDRASREGGNKATTPSSKRLNLGSLRLVSLEEYVDRFNHKVVDLFISNNQIKVLPGELVAASPNLESIDASFNLLEHVPDQVGELEKLKQLILFNNRIKTIPAPVFNAANLTFLELSVREKLFRRRRLCLGFLIEFPC